MSAADKVREYAAHTMGSETLWRHPFGLIYTDGMRLVAEVCEAWWLIDLIASHQPGIRQRHPHLACFQVWRILERKGGGADVEAWSDTPGMKADPETGEPGSVKLASQRIPIAYFPRDLMPFEWWVENGTAMMKEER